MDTRKTLFTKLILNDSVCGISDEKESHYKEWNKLILKEIGILDNLLPDYLYNDLWNIILSYLQIPFPKTNINQNFIGVAKYNILASCNYCANCVKTPDKFDYFNFRSSDHYLYCAICKSCLFKNECVNKEFREYCDKRIRISIKASMMQTRIHYSNMFLWLGLIDFDMFYYRKMR